MTKRKTIKNNPLDALHFDSEREGGFSLEESFVPGNKKVKENSDHSSRRVKKSSSPVSLTIKDRRSGLQENVMLKATTSKPDTRKESPPLRAEVVQISTAESSPDELSHRVSRLEEDNQTLNIILGIILAPLAILALLGAAPPW